MSTSDTRGHSTPRRDSPVSVRMRMVRFHLLLPRKLPSSAPAFSSSSMWPASCSLTGAMRKRDVAEGLREKRRRGRT